MPSLTSFGFSAHNRKDTIDLDEQLIDTDSQIPVWGMDDYQIDNLSVRKLRAGIIKSKEIVLDVSDGLGDVYFAAGSYDASAWTATNGIILGIDDSDSDREKFYIGNATDFMDWNVTTANKVTITNANISGTLSVGTLPGLPSDVNLTCHLSFDEGQGTSALDSTANANNGTLTNMADDDWVVGVSGTRVDLDGSNDYVSIDNLITTLASDTVGTIAFWAEIDADDNDENIVFSVSRDADATRTDFTIEFDMRAGNDYMKLELRTDGTTQWLATTAVDSLDAYVGTNLFVTVVQDGTEPKLYFNAVEQTLTFSTSTDKTKWMKALLTDATNKADTANIGIFESNSGDAGPFDGKVDEFRIYSATITEQETQALYKNPSGTTRDTYFQAWGHPSGVTQIDGGNIFASTVTAAKIDVSQLSAISADMGSITAGTITGGTIQTDAAASTGIKLTTTNLYGYDSSGNATFNLDSTTGNITAQYFTTGGSVSMQGISIPTRIYTSGDATTAGRVAAVYSNGHAYFATALTTTAANKSTGIFIESVADNTSCQVQFQNYNSNQSGLTTGSTYYLSDGDNFYNNGFDTAVERAITTTDWEAAVYDSGSNNRIHGVQLKLFRTNSAKTGNVKVSVRNESSDKPTGADIVSTNIDVSDLPVEAGGGAVVFTGVEFDPPVDMSTSTEYCIVVGATSLSGAGTVKLYGEAAAPDNAKRATSSDGGSTWATDVNDSIAIKNYEGTGQISTTAGTEEKIIGQAQSATEILLQIN